MFNAKATEMNANLDIQNNPNVIFENDFCIINLIDQTVVWKAGRFNPKMQKDINFWFNYKKTK
jgi:hypothetical protein